MLATSTDYGVIHKDNLMKVACTQNTQFLVQAELKAKNQGLEYKEIEIETGIYQGYWN
jgi:hypothetical protein